MSTKAVRFSEKEEKLIKDFLKENPVLDFSTLARVAIMQFIEEPEIKLKPIYSENKKLSKRERVH